MSDTLDPVGNKRVVGRDGLLRNTPDVAAAAALVNRKNQIQKVMLRVVALVACAIPAWRVTRVDPLIALRME